MLHLKAMGKGTLKVLSIVPTPANVSAIVRRFGRSKYGVVTTLNDVQIPILSASLDEMTFVDVKPFGQVVYQIYSRDAGYEPARIAASRQVLSAMRHVCNESDVETPFRKVVEMPGFHAAMADLYREFSHWGLLTEESKRALKSYESEHGHGKIHACLEIFTKVEEILSIANCKSVSRMIEDCLEGVMEPGGPVSRLLLFAGSNLNPQALRWLQWLVDHGVEVEVIVDRHATDGEIFPQARQIVSLLGGQKASPGEGNILLNNLFATSEHPGVALEKVEAHICGDVLSECEWAMRALKALPPGTRAAVFVRSKETYGPLLEHCANRFGVELRNARRVTLLSSGFVKMTLEFLNAIASSDIRMLRRPLSSSYVGFKEELDILEKIHFEDGDDWPALELQAEATTLEDAIFHLSRAREKVSEGKKSHAEWHGWLRTFFEAAPWLENADDRDLRAQTSLLSNLAHDALIQKTLQSPPISFEDWVREVEDVAEASDVSLPSSSDGIKVISQPEECGEIDCLLVLGMLEGTFPRRRSEHPILSDFLREELSAHLGGTPLLNSFDQAAAERDLFYKVCALPNKSLYLSYPMSSGDSDSVAAFYLSEVKRICGLASDSIHTRRHLTPAAPSLPVDEHLNQALKTEPKRKLVSTLTQPEAQDLATPTFQGIEIHQLSSLNSCIFKYVGEQIFPRPKSEDEHWRRLLSVPRRANLLILRDAKEAKVLLLQHAWELFDTWKPSLSEWEREVLIQGIPRIVDGWVEREFASRLLWSRNPADTQLSVQFGEEQLIAKRMGFLFEDSVAGITEKDGVRTVHVYRSSPPSASRVADVDDHLVRYGMYFASAWQGVNEVRVEVEGLRDHRTMLLFCASHHLPAEAPTYNVINLSSGDGSKQELRDRLEMLLGKNRDEAKKGTMLVTPGEHCAFCKLVDLCRKSDIDEFVTEVEA